MIKKIHASNKMTFSSNVNDVIKAVLNSFFFLRKNFTRTQKHKSTKHKDRTEQTHKTLQANKNKKCA